MLILSNSTRCDPTSPLISPDSNALSPCFIALLFAVLAAATGITGLFQLIKYLKFTPTYGPLISETSHQSLKNFLILVYLVISATLFLTMAITSGITFQLYAYAFSVAQLITILFPLHLFETSKSNIPTATLLFYWPCEFLLLLMVYIQQIFASNDKKVFPNGSELEPFLLFLSLLLSASIFIMEICYYRPNREFTEHFKDNIPVLSEPNVFSKLTFSWMNKLLQSGYDKGGLEQKDLPPPPQKISSLYATPRLEKNWNIEIEKKGKRGPSLLLALTKTFGFGVLGSLIFDMAESIVSFIQPLLLRLLIQFFNVKASNPLIIKGFTIAALMFITNILSTAFYNQYMIMTIEVSQAAKAALMSIVYNKAMKLSPSERNNRSTGDIINHMSVDVSRIESLASYVQTMVSAPTRLVLCLWSLYWLLGNATFMGIVTMAIMIPLNTILVKSLRKFHKQQMDLKDKRTSFVAEILQNIKSIKLYAWEDPMLNKLKYLRDDKELKNLNKIGVLSAGINFAWTCVPFFVSCSTFAAFAILSDIPLSPEIVFPALSLFDLLSDPIFAIPALITALIECNVSLTRIISFLLADEIDVNVVKRLPTVKKTGKKTVQVSNATFIWGKQINNSDGDENDLEATIDGTKAPALKNINFDALKGELTCVLGKVGAGKSTLLKCLLGELPVVSADTSNPYDISIAGSIAYCAQVPWIINATFKDNILFGHKYDEKFYNKTIDACQLTADLEILPDGHETLVGEKGISLSGGQKARLSLARAVYTRADVYLFDDILSAVDAHVGQNIIDKVLGKNGILSSKTRILSTNSIKVLNEASQVYLLENNTIAESGTLKEIMSNKSSELYRLIQEYGHKHTNDEVMEPQEEPKYTPSISSSLSSSSVDTNILIEGEYEGIGPLGVNVDDTTGEELARFEQRVGHKSTSSTLKAASIASFKQLNNFDNVDRKMNQTEETKEKGNVKLSTFKRYAQACTYSGIFITLSLVLITVGMQIGSNYWLMYWSEHNIKEGSNNDIFLYVGIYALLGIGSGFVTLIRAMCMWTLCSIRASKKLHSDMARAILKSPLQFFETTPLGRIINRFSQDMSKVDSGLPRIFSALFSSVIKTLLTMIIIGYNMPAFIFIILILSFVYTYYQKYYVVTIRDLKRITSITKSPIFALIQESINGCETVRAYDQRSRFSFLNSENIDKNQISSYCMKSTNRWLSTRLQFIGSIITLSTSLLALGSLYSKHRMSAGLIGLIMSYAMRVTSSLSFIVRSSVEIESDVICCERIFEYCNMPPEKDEESVQDELVTPPQGWPSEGKIKFDHYSTRYRENLDPVLNDISFSVQAKEKIGIVGRTGAGKSSLVLSIFRLIEPIEGHIEIDGINTSKLRLFDLRKNLSIIPQDAQCIEGTVRYNLDPLDQYDDDRIWDALKMSKLDDHIRNMAVEQDLVDTPLECQISESGGNLSVGQRQLVCLARVLLKTGKSKDESVPPSKILILDEATSSIDTETDNVIQQTIRTRCNHLTILTIAHRLNTIMDSDRILVLDKGQISEFDTPEKLLSSPDSLFYKLCVNGGYIPKPEGWESEHIEL